MQGRMMLWAKDKTSHPKANTLPDYASTSCLAYLSEGED